MKVCNIGIYAIKDRTKPTFVCFKQMICNYTIKRCLHIKINLLVYLLVTSHVAFTIDQCFQSW